MLFRCALAVTSLSLAALPAATLAAPPASFVQAKKLAWKLYPEQTEFYCGCRFSGNQVDLDSCGYQPRKNPRRAARIEWEHIVPAWVIGQQRQCWPNGGRRNCSRTDSVFQRAEADLHNLVPAIGELNGDRSNYAFGWLPQAPSQYGACPMVVDFKARLAMPRQAVRGTVARTYLYMSQRYRLRLSSQSQKLYSAWNKAYPAQPWERERNQRIGCVMGWGNPFVPGFDARLCSQTGGRSG